MTNMKSLKARAKNKSKNKHMARCGEEKKHEEEDSEETDGLDSDDDFFVEPPEVGDQFMACKPWIGAIKAPDAPPAKNANPPDEQYEIEFVHGYKSDLARQNLLYNPNQ